ncbi:hypothetical protein phytr_8830 [Candidatus Phycorickettsia trachydisci]|uniref:Uncharacterized protein n=1 Tax=Candidatus Phycorickettsia trachydisci TaxID=2115978 RepID=A0A2P1P976_9RICK|nr:hypothetical protein [Candidatus Phycorickettsia trachydisci]AVP87814.1 hypothetical protein phytr_8830 [Candidatus Phycorickettsia trachydisci]
MQDESRKIYAVKSPKLELDKILERQVDLALDKGLVKRELGPHGFKMYEFGKAGNKADQLYKAYFKISEGLRIQCKLYLDEATGAKLAYGYKIVPHDQVEAFKVQRPEAHASIIDQEYTDTTLESKCSGGGEENAAKEMGFMLHISFNMDDLRSRMGDLDTEENI